MLTQNQIIDVTEYYLENAEGFFGVDDYVATQFPNTDSAFRSAIASAVEAAAYRRWN